MHELMAIDVCIMCACESMTGFVHCISVLWFRFYFDIYARSKPPL